MNQNDKFHQDAQNASLEINDEALKNVVGGGNGDGYRFSHEETRFCPWCENIGPWEVYVNTNNPNDKKSMCKTCGNAGFRP